MLEGKPSEARQLYGDALRRWQELGLGTWQAMTQLDIVETGAMEPAERRRAADDARGYFERLGAAAYVARLDAALARAGAPAARTSADAASETGAVPRRGA
jgi:hypothetical protein